MRDTVTPRSLKLDGYSLKGVSTAGIGTCITVPEWRLCFDVAQGLPFAFSMNHFLITHLHQDHASGIPYLISQKAMQSHKPATFFLPPGTADGIHQIMKIWSGLEDHSYEFNLKELQEGEQVNLMGNLFVKSFPTLHRIRSQGYLILQKNKRLNPKYKGLSREEIIALKSQGKEIEEDLFAPKIAFTGDTQIEFLDMAPEVREAETLIMEITYIDEKKSVESARKWGHIHFKELVERIPQVRAKNIIWIHLSARYTRKQVQDMIRTHLPEHKNRIRLL